MVTSYNSQYRKHFKEPRWDDFAVGEYGRKLNYRLGRRSVEHQHQPLIWDSSESEQENEVETQQSSRLEVGRCGETHAGNHDIKNGISNEGEKTQQTSAVEVDRSSAEHIKPQSNNPRSHNKTKRRKRASKYKHKTKGDCNQPAAPPPSKVWNTEIAKEPFVPYGWANKAPIDKKYTYNVRASPDEVYPASLRALKRRELDVRRKLEETQRAAREKAMLNKTFFIQGRVSPTFLTEYQRSYCTQDGTKTGYVW